MKNCIHLCPDLTSKNSHWYLCRSYIILVYMINSNDNCFFLCMAHTNINAIWRLVSGYCTIRHFPGPLVCRIRQVLTSCTIRHFPGALVYRIRQVLTSCTHYVFHYFDLSRAERGDFGCIALIVFDRVIYNYLFNQCLLLLRLMTSTHDQGKLAEVYLMITLCN